MSGLESHYFFACFQNRLSTLNSFFITDHKDTNSDLSFPIGDFKNEVDKLNNSLGDFIEVDQNVYIHDRGVNEVCSIKRFSKNYPNDEGDDKKLQGHQ